MRRTLFPVLYLLALWCVSILFTFCQKDDDTQPATACTKDFRIAAVMPDNNPVSAPVLIKGKNFSSKTKIYFDNREAQVNFVADSIITTSVPGNLAGTNSLIELKLVDEACSFTTGFRIKKGFDDIQRISPPTIFLPNEQEKIAVNLQEAIAEDDFFDDGCYSSDGYRIFNIWGKNQALVFEVTNPSGTDQNTVSFEGKEIINTCESGTVKGQYHKNKNKVILTIYREQAFDQGPEILPADKLEGGFYQTTLLTFKGSNRYKILYLQSRITGRQYIFDLAN